ncbi:hypothetical protein JL721_11513 [Aureococcus anophagefferens]|nr:hypothetical protein JL721_11513 [Aureococcus anophagefferens]
MMPASLSRKPPASASGASAGGIGGGGWTTTTTTSSAAAEQHDEENLPVGFVLRGGAAGVPSTVEERVEDPYDPANPNDYVEIQKQKELAKAYERREKQRQVHLEKLEAEQARLAEERQRAAKRAMESGDLGAMSGLGLGSGNQMGRGRGVSNLPAWMKTRKAEPPKPAPAPEPEAAPFESAFDDGDVAPAPAAAPSAQPNIVPTLASRPLKTPTRVLLLKNMVAPDEMDAEFRKEETRSECGKYGAVEADDVFLAPHAPEDEAVRVFLAFSEKKHAIRAFLDMEGRFFGGRRITAGFCPEDRFAARDLAPGNDPV